MDVELIAITRYLRGDGTPEELLEHAGRVCYRSESRGDPGRFLRARIREGHESLIEHASATFEISGISRAASHQLVRHRLASYSQESQRYVSMSDPEWVLPPAIAENPEARALWEGFASEVKATYRALRELGVRKEDARFALPNGTATRIVVTMNLRELLHVFRLRISPAAQWEIRDICVRMLELVCPVAPNVFGDLREELRARYPSFFESSVLAEMAILENRKALGSLLKNEIVTLEPADTDNVALLVKWTLDPVAQGPYKRVPAMTTKALRDLFLHAADRWYFLIIRTADQKPLGRFYYRAWRFHPDSEKIDWELNILIADPAERGRGYGTVAQALALEFLLRLPETHSVFAYTFATNEAERCALQKAGFEKAGRMPSSYYRVKLPPEECVLYVRRRIDKRCA
jgi:thymidylate synthase (FAD)